MGAASAFAAALSCSRSSLGLSNRLVAPYWRVRLARPIVTAEKGKGQGGGGGGDNQGRETDRRVGSGGKRRRWHRGVEKNVCD